MIYLYERNKTGICVNRVFGYDGIVEIPNTLNGFPVTELGAYIFSDHIDVSELNKKKETGIFSLPVSFFSSTYVEKIIS